MTRLYHAMRTRAVCYGFAIACIWSMHSSLYRTLRELRRRYSIQWIQERFPELSHWSLLTADACVLRRAAQRPVSALLESERSRLLQLHSVLKRHAESRRLRNATYCIGTTAGRVLAASALRRLATRFGIAGPLYMIAEEGHNSLDLTHHLVRYLESIGVGNRDTIRWQSSSSDVTPLDGRLIEILRRKREEVSGKLDVMGIEDEYRFQMIKTLAIPTAFLSACTNAPEFTRGIVTFPLE